MTLRTAPRAAFEALRSLFFPLHCAGCSAALESGWFCSACRDDIRPIVAPCCEVCSQPFSGAMDRFACSNCRDRTFSFDCAVAVLQSRGVLRELIHRFKYNSETWLAGPLGEFLAVGLADSRLAGRSFAALVPVPLHPRRRREREYNQAELLAVELAPHAKLPVSPLLHRVRNTTTQTHFDRHRRMQNLRDAFVLRQNAVVQGLDFLLVDDVFTTGSTLNECARTLRVAGARSVSALTLARG